jgi:fatty-acyl-CoA synthase
VKARQGVELLTSGELRAADQFGNEVAADGQTLGEIVVRGTWSCRATIISGGENISSVEVEGTLLRHPAVQEAAIVELSYLKWGEALHAFVVLREGSSATEDELIAFTRERLAHFKAPHTVTFVAELPKTATGKIQKFVLRDHAPNLAAQ